MKRFILFLFSMIALQAVAQTKAEEILKRAIIKEKGYAYDKAVVILDSALKIDNKFAEAHYIKGLCLAQLNQIDSAEAEFKTTVTLDPKHAMAYYNLGYWRDLRGKKEEALYYMQKAWEFAPTNNDIGVEYVSLLFVFKKREEACVVIDKLVENGSQFGYELQNEFCK